MLVIIMLILNVLLSIIKAIAEGSSRASDMYR